MFRSGKHVLCHLKPRRRYLSTLTDSPVIPTPPLTSSKPLFTTSPPSNDHPTNTPPSPISTPFNLDTEPPTPRIIFSGIQPTGIPHLGNYLGALRSWVNLQNTAGPNDKLLFSIVDLHAMTTCQDAELLMKRKREMLAVLLAVGLNPNRCVLFCQSEVAAHEKMMWLLSTTTSMGYLERMTQWKSKSAVSKSNPKLGIFSYPVLQAADILLHRATHVPVGEDQSQHLEFARECVTKFNLAAGRPILVSPATILSPAKRIKSLTDPLVKMSKSDPNPMSRIVITETPAGIHKKIMAAKTDSENYVSYDPENRPGVSNLLTILFHFLPPVSEVKSVEELGAKYQASGMTLGEFKKIVSQCLEKGLRETRVKFALIMKKRDGRYLDHIAAYGADKAWESASATMKLIAPATGAAWKMADGTYRVARSKTY